MYKSPAKSHSYRLRYWSRFTLAFFLRFKGLLFVGLILGVSIFLISSFVFPRFFENKTDVIGITGRHTAEDLPNSILEHIGEGLTKLSADGLPAPALASSWDTPDKGKTWIFHLSDRTWQDGTRVTSSDINYKFSDVTVERPDEATIVYKLSDPFSPFPSVVSRPVFKSGFLGTGEWKVENAQLAGAYIQRITIVSKDGRRKAFKFYPTEERTKLAYKMGHVNSLAEIINPKPLDTWPTAKVESAVKENRIVTIFYNNEGTLFAGNDNKTLRQALNYAINKGKFEGERAISPIPPTNWVYNPQVKPYDYNVERAKELLDGVKVEDIEIKLVSAPALLSVAEEIKKDWEEIGIKAIVQISSVVPTDFQAYLTILDVPKDPDQYLIWHSTQKDSTNISNFGSFRIDKLLEDGRLELNPEARRSIYLDFQRFLVEELPAVFLYHPVVYTVTRS